MRPTGVATAFPIVVVLVASAVAGCSATRSSPGQSPSVGISRPSSRELTASCTGLAARDPSSTPQLTFNTAKSLAATAVPLCVVPKPGHEGLARLEGSTAEMTSAPEWAEAISFDRPVPSGVVVSLSYDMYAWVNGQWLLARLTGSGKSAQ
jgi:hypothetical protein